MTSRSLLAACAAVAVTATTCSSGDDTASDTSTSAATTTTTTEATTTTPLPTSSAETTTTTTEPPPTTEQPTTTTTTELVDEVQEVLDAYLAARDALDRALYDPSDESTVRATRALLGGRMLQIFDDRIEQFRNQNLRGMPSTEVPARVEVDRDTVQFGSDQATMRVCDVDSTVVVEIGAAPGGGDAVVNDAVVARVMEVTMSRSASGWLFTHGTVLAEFADQDHCEEQ